MAGAPQHGSAVIGKEVLSGRMVTITAAAGYVGPDTVIFSANDGRTQVTAAVSLDVIAPSANTAPACWADFGGPSPVRDRVTWVRTLACQDAEGDDIAVEVVTQPGQGTVADAGPQPGSYLGRSLAYTPAPGYTGPDTFVVRGRDTEGAVSGNFTVNVTVVAPSSSVAPVVCGAVSPLTVRAGGTVRIGGLCWGDEPSGYEILTSPAHGTVVLGQGFSYTPKPGYTGPDSFSYRLLSASGASSEITQPISVVAGANTAPSCWASLPGRTPLYPEELVVRAGSDAQLEVTCYDADGDPVTATVADPPHGAVSALVPRAPGPFEAFTATSRYTADAGFVGFDALEVSGNDGHGGTTTNGTAITVRAPGFNTPPWCSTIAGFPVLMIAGTEAQYDESCSDGEGDPVKLDVITPPQHVSFSPDAIGPRAPTAIVRAPASFTGVDSFEMVPVDDRGARGGLYGRQLQVVPDPGPVDRDVERGESVGSDQFELPTPSRPATVRLTTLNEGRVKIVAGNGTAPDGWSAFGLSFAITAPDAIPEAPLRLRFRFDASLRSPGEPAAAITVFRNGRPVPACTGQGATPDPCVAERTELRAGDLELLVLSSKASVWSFGRGSGPQAPPVGPPTEGPGSGPGGGYIGGGSGGGSGGQNGETVVQPPQVTVSRTGRLTIALAKGLPMKVTSSFAGTARAQLLLDGATAKRLGLAKIRRAVVVATARRAVRVGKATTLTLRFTTAARRALRRSKAVRLTLEARVNDGPVTTRGVSLRR